MIKFLIKKINDTQWPWAVFVSKGDKIFYVTSWIRYDFAKQSLSRMSKTELPYLAKPITAYGYPKLDFELNPNHFVDLP